MWALVSVEVETWLGDRRVHGGSSSNADMDIRYIPALSALQRRKFLVLKGENSRKTESSSGRSCNTDLLKMKKEL